MKYYSVTIWHKWTFLQNRLTDIENRRDCQGGGLDWELGISRCNYYIENGLKNKILLYNIGNYIECPVINHKGEENEKECVYIYIYTHTLYIYRVVYNNHFAAQQKLTLHWNQLYLNKTIFKKKKSNEIILESMLQHGWTLKAWC